ncbi:MAG TPA: hypothetical protein VN862_10015 [Candidatus Acidoferrales bacterium]|nr:hypothetical protein [Candidatus Acidoferrales bacterium]
MPFHNHPSAAARTILLTALAGFISIPLLHAGAAKQDQPEERVFYQTPSIRVRRTVYPPGRHLPMHEHKGRVVVFLSNGTVRTTTEGAQPSDLQFHRGMVYWSDPVRHTLDNVGGTPLDALEVEFLEPYPSAAQRYTRDAAAQDPAHFKVELENERVRVLRFTLGPHGSSPMHDHRDAIFVRLTPAHLQVTLPNGSKKEVRATVNDMGFQASARQAIQNVSDQPYAEILIEFKPSSKASNQ